MNSPILENFGEYKFNQYDYKSIKYPIDFNLYYSNISLHYENFGSQDFPIFVRTGYFGEYSIQDSDIVVSTGASSNHAYGSYNCMYSMLLALPFSNIVYIDYGLSHYDIDILKKHFRTINGIKNKINSKSFIAYRKFNWTSAPQWMNLFNNRRQRGGYAWKMIAFLDIVYEWKAIVIWGDAGNIYHDGISKALTAVRLEGFYSPPSNNIILKWVHTDSIHFMKNYNLIDYYNKTDSMASGGVLYIDYRNKTIRTKLIYPLRLCAYTQKCISPIASDMSNHRQDQAIISLLISSLHISRSANWKFSYGPSVHNDRDNNETECRSLLVNILKNIENVHGIKISSKYINIDDYKYTHQHLRQFRKQDMKWPSE